MKEQEKIRLLAQQDRRIETSGQLELFNIQEIAKGNKSYFTELRSECLRTVKLEMKKFLATKKHVEYASILIFLERPMIYEPDIKEWLSEWRQEGLIKIEGLESRERAPKRKKNHFIIWTGYDKLVF